MTTAADTASRGRATVTTALWQASAVGMNVARIWGFNEGDYIPLQISPGSYSEAVFKDGREEVIQAWYMDDSEEDQRLPHHKDPKEFVALDKLAELGVLSWRLDADNYEIDEDLKKIRESRGYSYMDFCEISPEKLPNYEEKVKSFFEEHLHIDEEIRYCVAGSGYFDVRDRNEAWIRVWVKKGGMIVLPAGIYHRFTLDSDNYIKAMRLFVGEPVWTPYNHTQGNVLWKLKRLFYRKEYVDNFVKVNGAGCHRCLRIEDSQSQTLRHQISIN